MRQIWQLTPDSPGQSFYHHYNYYFMIIDSCDILAIFFVRFVSFWLFHFGPFSGFVCFSCFISFCCFKFYYVSNTRSWVWWKMEAWSTLFIIYFCSLQMKVNIYRLCAKNHNLMITLSYSQLLATLRQSSSSSLRI